MMESEILSRGIRLLSVDGNLRVSNFISIKGRYGHDNFNSELLPCTSNDYIKRPSDEEGLHIWNIMSNSTSPLYVRKYRLCENDGDKLTLKDMNINRSYFISVVEELIDNPLDFLRRVAVFSTDDGAAFPYPLVCGGYIVSPAFKPEKISSLLGVNLNFGIRSLKLRNRESQRIYVHDTKLFRAIQVYLAVRYAISLSKNVIYITDSNHEDHTSDIFGNSFIVSKNKRNQRTGNKLVTRIAYSQELIERLEQEIVKELETDKESWEKLKSILIELAVILRYFSRKEIY
jgi:hypothetical protein